MRILLWHVHGSWTTAFVQGRHDYLLPVLPDRGPNGRGRARTWAWPASVVERTPRQLRDDDVDVLIVQRPEEELLAAQWLGRRVPTIWLEHNAPQGRINDLRHPAADRSDVTIERKGIGNVISALAELPGVELVVAGGPARADLPRHPEARRFVGLAERLGVADRVELRGAVARDEVPGLLRSADVVACCPWYEPFGLVAVVDVPDLDLPWHADTIVHPGASAPARRWPASRWAVVAEQEAATGRQVHVTGTEAEADLCWRVSGLAGLGKPGSLAGKTGLLELLALVGRAQRVVCGDTGVAHVAWATGTPSLVLYGPTSPAAWGPPAGPHLALWRGRTGDPHAERPHGGLLAIEVNEVLDALDQLPDRIGAA
jgi:hypothetical protein